MCASARMRIALGHMTLDELRRDVAHWRGVAEKFCDQATLTDLDQRITMFLQPQHATDTDMSVSHRDALQRGLAILRDIHHAVLNARLRDA